MTPPLHPDLGQSAQLLGMWEGQGHGDYPTITAFDYLERVEFGHVGKPFISYRQATKHADDQRPLHAEVGYLRAIGSEGAVELLLSQPTGISEVHQGRWTQGDRLELDMVSVTGTPTAVEVAEVRREIELIGDILRYRFSMATSGLPLQLHLEAELHRTG